MQKKTKKTKFIKSLHTIADKTGKGIRKAGPVLVGIAVGFVLSLLPNGKGGSKKG